MKTLATIHLGKEHEIALEFKKEDAWIGAYWTNDRMFGSRYINIWMCVIPFFPLRISLVLPSSNVEHMDSGENDLFVTSAWEHGRERADDAAN